MKKILLAMTVAVVAIGVAVPVAQAAAPPGKVVGSGRASGQFAIASASANVNKPRAIYGRTVGRIDNATFIIACSRGFNISSNSFDRSRAGTWRLPIMRNADSCMVTGSAGGSGSIRIEIRRVG